MINFHRIVVISAVSLLALAGCQNSQPSATVETSPSATPIQTPAPAASQQKYSGLLNVVSKTKLTVSAGDFAKAKTDFDEFEKVWEEVEDGIKAKSDKIYEAIEESMDKTNTALKQSSPNKDQVLAELQSIEKNINSLSP